MLRGQQHFQIPALALTSVPTLGLRVQAFHKTLQDSSTCDLNSSQIRPHLQESKLVMITHWCYQYILHYKTVSCVQRKIQIFYLARVVFL